METEYERDAQGEYLVLRIRSSGLKKIIPVKEVGSICCDHDYLESDDGRCWDCGVPKPRRHPSLNWALPKIRAG